MPYLVGILYRETDDSLAVALIEITDQLETDGINVDRQTLYFIVWRFNMLQPYFALNDALFRVIYMFVEQYPSVEGFYVDIRAHADCAHSGHYYKSYPECR